ncbi:MAG: IPT/TIG domain-containing protein, partial [Chloroflexota bacterium]|nr:IPT/TIG domain-containing protein [Chloroflexota bacterium]
MRKIVTAVTAASLALSMLAMAVPASAVSGYDSAYAGESAFVNISPGQTQSFQVFFANTGTTTWSRGTGTQVDLAACLEDKNTCNAQDATEASWNSGWLSSTRYATTTQTTTAPGALGTFSYNITAPVGALAGTYRFNGDLVLSTTGEKIHPDGYYQDATIGGAGGGAATITSLTPAQGTSAGGTSVVIAGSGFICTPAFPSVSFGGTNAAVLSCGGTSVTATSPVHAPGAVTVTVTNSGSAASNGLIYNYQDTAAPVFTSFTVSGDVLTVTFSEPVCRVVPFTNPSTDWTVNNVSAATIDLVTSDSIPNCTVANDTFSATANLILTTPMPTGAFVETTLGVVTLGTPTTAAADNEDIRDAAGNPAAAPQSRQATASAPDTTAPTVTSASGNVGGLSITINFSEPVYCSGGTPAGTLAFDTT